MAQNFLQKIAAEAKKADYPFSFFCQVNDDDTNEETIQLSSSINKVNVYFTDKKTSSDGTSTGRRALIEKGCALVLSQGVDGTLVLLISPYKSERHEFHESEIFLSTPLHPSDITQKRLEGAVSDFIFYARFTSLLGRQDGKFNFDILRYYWLRLKDFRTRRKASETLLNIAYDWSKILAAGGIGYIIAKIT